MGEIGDDVGLQVVVDEEVEQDEEDRELKNILKKRKLATGTVHNILMLDRSNSVQYSTHLNSNIYYNAMSNMSDI